MSIMIPVSRESSFVEIDKIDRSWNNTNTTDLQTRNWMEWHRLCDFCKSIFADENVRKHACAIGSVQDGADNVVINDFQPVRFGDLVKSAAGGCHLCRLLLHVPDQDDEQMREIRKNLAQDTLVYAEITAGFIRQSNFLLFDSRSEKRDESFRRPIASLPLVKAHKREINHIWHRRHTAAGAISDSSVMQINNWMLSCLKSHPRCQAAAHILGSGAKPKRLIDVGDHNGALSLRQSDELGQDFKYVTLTHCWGNSTEAHVWKNAFVDDEGWIDINRAPQLLKDAAEVVRSLPGLLYLWVDAICIDQNSTEDWERESAKMGDIYAHAVLNLSATAAKNGMDHLLPPMPSTSPCMVPINCVEGGMHYLLAYVLRYSVYQIEEALINTRGWVLQERMLSPRTVHFAEDQMVWECFSLTLSDVLPRTGDSLRQLKSHAIKTRKLQEECDTNTPWYMQYDPWHFIVEFYSERHLSKPSDKFAAIAGMASRIARQLRVPDTDYLAGLWRRNIDSDLLWYTGHKAGPTRTGRAPSWSWARTDRRVRFCGMAPSDQSYVSVLRASVGDPRTPFLGTVRGVLRLRAPFRRISILDDERPTYGREEVVVDTGQEDLQIRRFDVVWDEYEPDPKRKSAFLLIIKCCHRAPDRESTPNEDDSEWTVLYEDRFGIGIFTDDTKNIKIRCVGLIVQPTGVKAGEYERLRLLVLAPSSVESLVQYGKEAENGLAAEHYISHDPECGYVIDLV